MISFTQIIGIMTNGFINNTPSFISILNRNSFTLFNFLSRMLNVFKILKLLINAKTPQIFEAFLNIVEIKFLIL